MSKPKRYWVCWHDQCRLDEGEEASDGGDVMVDYADYAHLKAEVERLTKAGDAMASSIQFNEEMAKDYNGPTIVHQSVQRWNAAREGKQS